MVLKIIPEYITIKGEFLDKTRFPNVKKSKWYVIKIGRNVTIDTERNTKTEAKNYCSVMNHFNRNFAPVKILNQLHI